MTAQTQLANWVKQKYQGRLIKKTSEPYFNHLQFVADLAGPFTKFGYETGLCHDLLEDTPTTAEELIGALRSFGYSPSAADMITACVVELTDMYTKKDYPHLTKTERKRKEATRLGAISATAQTVKYADLIYNIQWTVQHEPSKAVKYLLKKQGLLTALHSGNQTLRQQVLNLIATSLGELGEC